MMNSVIKRLWCGNITGIQYTVYITRFTAPKKLCPPSMQPLPQRIGYKKDHRG